MVADIADVAKDESTFIGRLSTSLADGAVETPPTFLYNHGTQLKFMKIGWVRNNEEGRVGIRKGEGD